ncbi:DNA methylase [Euryarchaeota archaeon ex4484_178]|nr:MAG: DNA methylase [Euryarchaeota archaeon ex4484_178]
MKKRKLEILLEGVEKYRNPKSFLEQYFTPAVIAADILFFAWSMGDVEGKTIADLGAGTGIFTIGSGLLDAKMVYSVEIDKDAIEILKKNMEKYGIRAKIILGDVRDFNIPVDTVIQNPPFGSQNRHADLPFLEKAMEIGKVIYTLHNANTNDFIEEKIEAMGGKITHKKFYDFPIPHMFNFHRKERVIWKVILYRVNM